MSESTIEVDQLSSYIGLSPFFPSLLAYIRNASPTLPFEPVVLQSLLICIVAGHKHLILRTAEDDVHLVTKLAAKGTSGFAINASRFGSSAHMLSSIFGITTHRLKMRKPENPDLSPRRSINTFLRSLFIHSTPNLHTTHSFHDETSTLKGKYRHSRQASRSRTVRSVVHYGMTSYLNDSSKSSQFTVSPPNSPDHYRTSSLTSGGLSNGPSNPFSTISRNSSSSAIHPTFLHSYSDPTPLRHSRLPENHIQLPGALILSGLENASIPVQRALNTVLADRTILLDEDDKISLETGTSIKNYRHSRFIYEDREAIENDDGGGGVWTLPDDFILVYVCPIDEWERPDIHKPLLDKFAMSVTVTLASTTRSHLTSISRPLSFRGSPILSPVPLLPGHASSAQSFVQTIPSRQMSPGMLSTTSNKSINTTPLIIPELIRHLKKTYTKVLFPPSLNIFLSDLFSAARHHHQVDGTLLTAKAMSEAIELARAARVLGVTPTGVDLIERKMEDLVRLRTGLGIGSAPNAGSLSESMNREEEAWIDIIDYDDMQNGRADASADPHLPTVSGTQGIGDNSAGKEFVAPLLDVTQEDVARIFPRIVTHRLRVRNGPEDEIFSSAVYGATSALYLGAEGGKTRRIGERHITIKDILVSILQTVD
ncbi:hypothetical protein D9758_006766 [Tetrapyrgos nigripes]|uniref:Uncharacterized protein n=1 Tax=Tetrapyrgos nigripes TaxID=182062 RepID=A0A8H5FTN2_9AGAR|nr:hypothetical protein D9758_006766 [Tetrapyrgos nigripes]